MKAAAAFAIINFVWQGGAIGALAWLGFSLSRSPRIRYLIGIGALALMAAAPVATSLYSYRLAAAERAGSSAFIPAPVSVSGPVASEAVRENGNTTPVASGVKLWTLAALPQVDPQLASAVFAFWMIGVIALSARLTVGWLGARRLTRRVSEAGASVQAIASQLIAKLSIRARVRIVESALVKVPAVVGAFKPVVLLPAAAMSGLSMEQVEALLAHELAHVRRHDYLVNLLQSAVETLLFYHPAVWLVSRRVRQERELCCDDMALAVCGDRVAYASALADLESMRALPSPALAATGGSLLSRIRRILGQDETSALSGRSKSLAGVAILASIILLVGGQAARDRSLLAAGEEIVAADGTGGLRSPNAPQIPGPVVGVQGGVAGGVIGGVPQGVVGGVADGVQGGVAGGVQDGVAGGVPSGVQIGVVGGVSGGAVAGVPPGVVNYQRPEPWGKAGDGKELTLNVGAEISIAVFSPVPQPIFAAQRYKVAADGTIRLPGIERPLNVVGLNGSEVREAIRRALVDSGLFNDPIVDVGLLHFVQRAPQADLIDPTVYVFGEVRNPGAIDSSNPLTVVQAIALAGGQLPSAALNRLKIIRVDSSTGKRIELKAVKLLEDVRAGDTIIVPERSVETPVQSPQAQPEVVVQGAVRTPGTVQLPADRVAVSEAISRAGGFQPTAGPRIFIKRSGAPDVTLSKVEILQGRASFSLQNGDVITVEVAKHFYVTGFVKSAQAEYTWESGLTLGQAIALAGGVSPEGAIGRAKIERKDPKTGKFSPVKFDKDPMATLIEPNDVINVPKKRM